MEIIQFSYPNWLIVEKYFDLKKIVDRKKHFLSFLSLIGKDSNFYTSLDVNDAFKHVFMSVICKITLEELLSLQGKRLEILILDKSLVQVSIMISASLFDFYNLIVNDLNREAEFCLRVFLTKLYILFETQELDLIFKEKYVKEEQIDGTIILKKR